MSFVKVIVCHIVGDYLLQTDYMAREKNNNLYILFVHCVCYCLPFIYVYGLTYKTMWLFASHIFMDWMKIKGYTKIWYDQIWHYVIAFGIYAI